MKFTLNGALTIGTLDGANVEIREEVGAENFFLFGLTADEVERSQGATATGRATTTSATPSCATALDLIAGGRFSRGDRELFRPLVDNLLDRDPFLVLADYAAYVDCQEQVERRLARPGALDAHVDPQHRAQREVLLRPRHPRVLRGDLERAAGEIHLLSALPPLCPQSRPAGTPAAHPAAGAGAAAVRRRARG